MNDGAARFTGSHITYVDYDKAAFKAALDAGSSVAPTVKEAGELFDTYEQPRPFTGTQHTHTHTHTHMIRLILGEAHFAFVPPNPLYPTQEGGGGYFLDVS